MWRTGEISVLDEAKRIRIKSVPPERVPYDVLLQRLSEYDTIKFYRIYKKTIFVEFANRTVDDLLKNPICINDIQLRIHRSVESHSRPTEQPIILEYKDAICYDTIKPTLLGSKTFDGQLEALLNAIELTESDLKTKYDPVCAHLEYIFKPILPKCKVYKFGSTQATLGFKEADLDICIDIGEEISDVQNDDGVWTVPSLFSRARKIMSKLRSIFRKQTFLKTARVPIIKFYYAPTGVPCDVQFSNGLSLGFYKTQLVRYCLSLDSRVRPLMMVIKYWARHYNLTSSVRSIPSFALVLLIIFFLQQPTNNIIPPIIELQSSCVPETIDGWQANFDTSRPVQRKATTSTIPELLHAFFLFYSTLDYSSVIICPIDGILHPRELFRKAHTLPPSMIRYKQNWKSCVRPIYNRAICVQDPIELKRNVMFSLSKRIVKQFPACCDTAAKICESAKTSAYKGLIEKLLDKSLPVKKVPSSERGLSVQGQHISKKNSEDSVVTSMSVADDKISFPPAINFTKRTLEEYFGLKVTYVIIDDLKASDQLCNIILVCNGTWNSKECKALKGNGEAPIEREVSQSEDKADSSLKINCDDVVNMNFICRFSTKYSKKNKAIELTFINCEANNQHWSKFVNVATSKIPKIVPNTANVNSEINIIGVNIL